MWRWSPSENVCSQGGGEGGAWKANDRKQKKECPEAYLELSRTSTIKPFCKNI